LDRDFDACDAIAARDRFEFRSKGSEDASGTAPLVGSQGNEETSGTAFSDGSQGNEETSGTAFSDGSQGNEETSGVAFTTVDDAFARVGSAAIGALLDARPQYSNHHERNGQCGEKASDSGARRERGRSRRNDRREVARPQPKHSTFAYAR